MRYYQHPDANKLTEANDFVIRLYHRGDTSSGLVDEDLDLEIYNDANIATPDHSLIAVVNILRPIKPQLDEIRRVVIAHQKELAKNQKELAKTDPKFVATRAQVVSTKDANLWAEYLKCIDAKAAKIVKREAIKYVFGSTSVSPEKWDHNFKQIKKLASHNYRHFMF